MKKHVLDLASAARRKASTASAQADSKAGDELDDEDEEKVNKVEDPAQMALPTFLMAGTIVGSVFRVDMTKVKVDVETNDLSEF